MNLFQKGKYTSMAESMRALSPFSFSGSQESCTELQNEGTYFSVEVGVGTPPQTFKLVADTGSSAVIVESCICVGKGGCALDDKCFTGTNRSSTFQLPQKFIDDRGEHVPTMISMTFGSGTVDSVIASDVVTVGDKHVMMTDGLLLYVDRHELKVSGYFGGILGLGIQDPKPNGSTNILMPSQPKAPDTKLFLKQAGVERFSLCFNDNGEAGALRLGLPSFTNGIPSIGLFHWGLGLIGLSIGGASEPSLFCNPSTMAKGQSTPCAMIPDSGTTLLMGPKNQIEKTFAGLCDKWERCRSSQTTGVLNKMTKSQAFQALLYDCGSWLSDEPGAINEVPSIFLTLGETGHSKVIELTAWAYITETIGADYPLAAKHLFEITPIEMVETTRRQQKVCVPSFGVQAYDTQVNGPVWIMGTPLFYQFTVGYDLGHDYSGQPQPGPNGPKISFSEGGCSACNEPNVNFLSKRSELVSDSRRSRSLRKVSGAPRTPAIDTSLPL